MHSNAVIILLCAQLAMMLATVNQEGVTANSATHFPLAIPLLILHISNLAPCTPELKKVKVIQRAKVVHSDYHSLVKVSERNVIAMTIFVPYSWEIY